MLKKWNSFPFFFNSISHSERYNYFLFLSKFDILSFQAFSISVSYVKKSLNLPVPSFSLRHFLFFNSIFSSQFHSNNISINTSISLNLTFYHCKHSQLLYLMLKKLQYSLLLSKFDILSLQAFSISVSYIKKSLNLPVLSFFNSSFSSFSILFSHHNFIQIIQVFLLLQIQHFITAFNYCI